MRLGNGLSAGGRAGAAPHLDGDRGAAICAVRREYSVLTASFATPAFKISGSSQEKGPGRSGLDPFPSVDSLHQHI
jgi:hypothetical protein